ncbi:hypothetical protein LTR16_011938, partial [Cryomyces antarcticus]
PPRLLPTTPLNPPQRPRLRIAQLLRFPRVPHARADAGAPGTALAEPACHAAGPPAAVAERARVGDVREEVFVEERVGERAQAVFEGVGGKDVGEDGAQVGE